MADAGHGAARDDRGRSRLRRSAYAARGAPARSALPGALTAGASTTWRFRIIGCDGNPVRHFDRDNTKLLHLIVVRTDLSGYQHLHPTLSSDGTFTIELRTARPGSYRAITDFVIDGRKYVLGTTLTAPGPSAQHPAACTGGPRLGRRIRRSSSTSARRS